VIDPGADHDQALVLDGNAVAGLLAEMFSVDMTASPTICVGCGNEGRLATLLAFTQGPGVVLRCPMCESVVLRIVHTPSAVYLDARGTRYLCLERRVS
jgi:hypothetical protein